MGVIETLFPEIEDGSMVPSSSWLHIILSCNSDEPICYT